MNVRYQRTFEVILVDDDKVVLLLHRILTTKSGLDPAPLAFENGKEALEHILGERDPEKDYCVLLDINMPVMNGWEFLEEVERSPIAHQVSVVMVTSSIDKSDRAKATQYSLVIEFLEKPLNVEMMENLKKLPALGKFFG